MARKKQGKFKMKGHTLPGINQKSETTSLKDGRAQSSALQMKDAGDSPNKFLGLAAMGAGALLGRTKFGKRLGKGISNVASNIGEKLDFGGDGDAEAEAGKALLKEAAMESIQEGAPMQMKSSGFKMKGSPHKNYKNPQEYKAFKFGNEPTPFKEKLRSGQTATVGGKLGGSAYKTASPFNQVPLQPGEDESVQAYDGDDTREIIADLEDRIEFIKEDIWNTQEGDADAPADVSQGTEEQQKAIRVLQTELDRLYEEEGYKDSDAGAPEGAPEKDIPEGEIPMM